MKTSKVKTTQSSGRLRRLFFPKVNEVPPIKAFGPILMALGVLIFFIVIIFLANKHYIKSPEHLLIVEAFFLVTIGGFTAWRAKKIVTKKKVVTQSLSWKWIVGGPIAVITTTTIVGFLSHFILPHFKIVHETAPNNVIGWVCLLIAMVVIAPIVEELVFRGWLQRSLAVKINPGIAVIFTGVLFGVAHIWLSKYTGGEAVEVVAAGIVLGYLSLHSGSLIPNILGHMTMNSLAFLTLIDAFQSEVYGIMIFLVGLFLLIMWIFKIGIYKNQRLKS